MASILSISEIAFLIGDPARTNMLFCLQNSDMASAADLTRAAGVAPSTASEHLAKLTQAGLVSVSKMGRHRYFSLGSPQVAELLEGIDALAGKLAPDGPPEMRHDQAALHARTCGDHLAGHIGVAITQSLLASGHIRQRGKTLNLSHSGRMLFQELDVPLSPLNQSPRRFMSLCHDWSEDAFHLGGGLGGAFLETCLIRDWMRRPKGRAYVDITPKGRSILRKNFGIEAGTTIPD
ncbi:MAG: helix-turn-helix transcriptional regulator [Boseongicola sp.]|nr:helix-turn-helix transcriptional regulator [Boseongicola sp.]